jgi:hypothetical protein
VSREERLCRYVRTCADQVGLRDWEVVVSSSATRHDELATVEIPTGRRIMRLTFCESFEELPDEAQRHAVAHELVHVLHHALYEEASAIREELAPAAFRVFYAHFEVQVESVVDTLALIVAPTLPVHQ